MDKHRCDERHKTARSIEILPALVPAQWPFRPVYDTTILLFSVSFIIRKYLTHTDTPPRVELKTRPCISCVTPVGMHYQ